MVATSGITGCCASTNLYNLGGAHGHPVPATQEDFELQLRGLGGTSSVTVAITNDQQERVRKYLETCGFHTHKLGPRMQVHMIYGPDLTNYLQKRASHLAEYQRNKREKREAKKAKFAVAEGQVDPPVGVRRNGIFPGMVTWERVLALRPRNFNRDDRVHLAEWRTAINNFYNVNIMIAPHEGHNAYWENIRNRIYRAVHAQRQRAGLI